MRAVRERAPGCARTARPDRVPTSTASTIFPGLRAEDEYRRPPSFREDEHWRARASRGVHQRPMTGSRGGARRVPKDGATDARGEPRGPPRALVAPITPPRAGREPRTAPPRASPPAPRRAVFRQRLRLRRERHGVPVERTSPPAARSSPAASPCRRPFARSATPAASSESRSIAASAGRPVASSAATYAILAERHSTRLSAMKTGTPSTEERGRGDARASQASEDTPAKQRTRFEIWRRRPGAGAFGARRLRDAARARREEVVEEEIEEEEDEPPSEASGGWRRRERRTRRGRSRLTRGGQDAGRGTGERTSREDIVPGTSPGTSPGTGTGTGDDGNRRIGDERKVCALGRTLEWHFGAGAPETLKESSL